ncbi:MAG: enoyl-CoA hydratase [Acidimicrobiales bacterium]|nr:enoyl-CoA hydratase [Acidimicrobiales bacterium]RZV48852.1 MAG: enoyl-CoA hydratase [Acidimicrobiales bacterium]
MVGSSDKLDDSSTGRLIVALPEFETIRLDEMDNRVFELVLARPPANALSKQMAFELRQAASWLAGTGAARAVVLRGEGKVFFGGGDLAELSSGGDMTPSNLNEMTIDFHGAIHRLATMDAPVVTGVTGTAGGAGVSTVAASDLVVAGESARFVMAYTAAGLTPDGTSTFFLSRVVGLRRATEMVLTNRMLSATEALGWGLINRVVPDDVVVAEARALAAKLAEGPTHAYGGAKRLLIAGASSALAEAMERESYAIAQQSVHPEAVEGMDAFLNKRKPSF